MPSALGLASARNVTNEDGGYAVVYRLGSRCEAPEHLSESTVRDKVLEPQKGPEHEAT